jgi:hypothetical protein
MPPTKVTLTAMFRCDGIAKIYPGDYHKASKAAHALILKCVEAKIREKYPKHFDGDYELQEEGWLFWSMFHHTYGDKYGILAMIKDNSLHDNNDRELEGQIEELNTYGGEPVLHDDPQATKDDVPEAVSFGAFSVSELSTLPHFPDATPTVLGTDLSGTAKKMAKKDLKYWSSSIAVNDGSIMKPFKQVVKVCVFLDETGFGANPVTKEDPIYATKKP